jgi:hypothetical protein
MFFVRSIFWLSLVFVLLPVAPEDQDKIEAISPIEAVGAAAAAVRDISGFCARNPDTCETGGKAAVALGYKAKYGAQQLLSSSGDESSVEAKEPAGREDQQPSSKLPGTIAGIIPSEDSMSIVQSTVSAITTPLESTQNTISSAEAIVPEVSEPGTPTPRARPNI